MPSRTIPQGQDWTPQVYHSRAQEGTQQGGHTPAANSAQDGQKKQFAKSNAQVSTAGANAKKLDEDNESLKVKKVDTQLRVRIMKARQALNWSQQDLAQKISERVTVVTEYESGKAIPDERVIMKMEKAFGMHLRGAKAGEPMGKNRPQPKPEE